MDFSVDGASVKNSGTVIVNQRATIDALKRENTHLKEKLGDTEEFYSAVAGAVAGIQPFPTPRKSRSESKPKIAACLMLSDWHIGEVVDAEETGGANEYNYEIAQSRLFTIVDDFLKWVELNRNSYTIDECCVFTLGDMVTGNIHREMLDTNEFTLPVAVANAGEMLGEAYARLQPHFNKLRALQVGGGNHDRVTALPRFKKRVEDSYGALVHHIANARMNKAANFYPETPKAFATEFDIAGKVFHATHGDVIQGQMGIPYYGFWRYVSRVARKRLELGLPKVDSYLFGHWHQFGVLDDGLVIMNRALIGPTEYDMGAQRYSKPGQVSFLVSPKHGVFNITSFVGE